MLKEIVIHCSASPNFRPHSAEDIHRWHLERGWDGIGYHEVICLNGSVESGRPHYWMGSHAKGYNKNSIGICLIGTDEFTDDQLDSLYRLILSLKDKYPQARVIGHNQISSKSCPGFDVQKWLKDNLIK